MPEDEQAASPDADHWGWIKDDIQDLFSDEVEVNIRPGAEYADVRILPHEIEEKLETENDVDVVMYNALRMTVKPRPYQGVQTGSD